MPEGEDDMAREWSLKTVTGLRFRELEKTLIEIFGCIPVDYKQVIRLDVRKGMPLVQPEVNLGATEKMIVDVFGCMPPDKQVIEFTGGRDRKKVVVKIIHEDNELFHQKIHCA